MISGISYMTFIVKDMEHYTGTTVGEEKIYG